MSATVYTIIPLEQDTLEWHAWRQNGIGASEARTVLGKNPFHTKDALLREKIHGKTNSRHTFSSAAAERGKNLEPEARKAYITKYGIHVRPLCVQSIEHEWLRASLDGMSLDGQLAVEIKSGRSDYAAMWQRGNIPEWHHWQLQHIMAVTGLECIDYWGYDPERGGVRFVHERNELSISEMLEKMYSFWQQVQQGRLQSSPLSLF